MSLNFFTQIKQLTDSQNKANELKHLYTYPVDDLSVWIATSPEHENLIGVRIHLDSEPSSDPDSWPIELHECIEDAFKDGFSRVIIHTPQKPSNVIHLNVGYLTMLAGKLYQDHEELLELQHYAKVDLAETGSKVSRDKLQKVDRLLVISHLKCKRVAAAVNRTKKKAV